MSLDRPRHQTRHHSSDRLRPILSWDGRPCPSAALYAAILSGLSTPSRVHLQTNTSEDENETTTPEGSRRDYQLNQSGTGEAQGRVRRHHPGLGAAAQTPARRMVG